MYVDLEMNIKLKIEKCPICGEELIVIDNMNYFTSICPKCFSTIFEEFDGKYHIIKNGINKNDNYDISMDIFYKQLLMDSICIKKEINEEDVIKRRFFNLDIYDKRLFNHFYKNVKDFNMKQFYIYFDGYKKYLDISEDYYKDFNIN